MTSPAIGARVSVEARALFPKSSNDLEGTVQGALRGGMLLINFGPGFDGHNGYPEHTNLARGEFGTEATCYYVMPDYVTEVLVTKKPKHTKKQDDRILNHLVGGSSISQLEAFGVYGIFRLAARIYDLKKKGHKIKTTMKQDANGKPYAEYALVTARRA